MAKMNQALKDPGYNPKLEIPRTESLLDQLRKKTLSQIDIYGIGATGFRRHEKRKEIKIFYTSLYKIERLIKRRLLGEAEEDKQEIIKRLSKEYYKFADVFLKQESDLMLLSCKNIDFKIYFKDKANPVRDISHRLIYKINTKELKAAYKYITENLEKGFIAPSSAPFASPILMARHPSTSKLRFCVDFRRLNTITKKDQYLILLVNELIDCLASAKYFTKLNIYQGFHCIRISPES
jgi:hypothetical protein